MTTEDRPGAGRPGVPFTFMPARRDRIVELAHPNNHSRAELINYLGGVDSTQPAGYTPPTREDLIAAVRLLGRKIHQRDLVLQTIRSSTEQFARMVDAETGSRS